MTSLERLKTISDGVDAKASAIGHGAWDDKVVDEIATAIPFEMTEREVNFLRECVDAVSHDPNAW